MTLQLCGQFPKYMTREFVRYYTNLFINTVIHAKSMATEALKSNPRHLRTCKQSDDWYYATKQLFLSR